jgi:hypothetical protein
MAQLNSYVEAGDASSFNHYMDEIRTSFAGGARSAVSGARGALGGMQGEERRALMEEMRSEYGAAREQYVACKHAAVVGGYTRKPTKWRTGAQKRKGPRAARTVSA